MNASDIKKLEASIKVLEEEHKKLEAFQGEWEDKISELEEKDTDSSYEKAEELQGLKDFLEEQVIALDAVITGLNELKDS